MPSSVCLHSPYPTPLLGVRITGKDFGIAAAQAPTPDLLSIRISGAVTSQLPSQEWAPLG